MARDIQRHGTRSTTRFGHRMRCNATRKCGKRFTLPRHPNNYVQRSRVLCPACGGPAYSDEKTRQRELAAQDTCQCHGVPFRHRRGSIMGCESHESATRDWTYEEEQDHLALLHRPRGGSG